MTNLDSDCEPISRCPACGDPIDYCQGHGEMGDPAGYAILRAHDDEDHSGCHPDGCDEAGDVAPGQLTLDEKAGGPYG